jgi:phage terminase small subunit
MPQIKTIIDSADKEELNKYCDSYDGFYRYMNRTYAKRTFGTLSSCIK